MSYLENDYLDAISKGHYQKVIYFIESGIDVNAKDENGETAIKKAIKSGYREIIKYLIQNGVNLKSENSNLIFEVAKKGYLDIVISLLKYENSSKIRKEALNIAQKALNQKNFMQGIQEQNIEKVSKGIANGVDINKLDILSWSPLMNATYKGNKNITKLLIDNGVDINYRNKNNETALIKAVEKGELFIVKLLLENGANPNIKDIFNNSSILFAVKHGDLDMIKLLLNYGADINIENNDKESPLKISIENNYIDITKYLIKRAAVLPDMLKISYDNKHFYLTEILLDYETDKNKVAEYKNLLKSISIETKLEIEIKKNNLQGIKDILKNNNSNNLNELLFMSTKLLRYKIVSYLILLGANPNTYINNLSPIMIAVSCGDYEMVETLISLGADVNGKGNFILGFPITIAINEGHFSIVKLLVENGADIYRSYGFKLSALEEAKLSNDFNIKSYFEAIS